MKLKAVSGITLTLLLIGMLILTFNIQPVKASGTIYIRADGSIEGTTDISTVDNGTYTLTDNINESIVIERDNIIVDGAGYTVQGSGSGIGVDLSGRNNVTTKNMKIKAFSWGIYLAEYSNGIKYSSNNTVSGNTITNNEGGITLYTSSNNNIFGNTITANNWYSIHLWKSDNNSVFGNSITNSYYGIWLDESSNNKFYHNNFMDNNEQINSDNSTNVWDHSYPFGGNYWNDHTSVDVKSGPDQNETGNDGIGDTPYVIDGNNRDNYPLIHLYGSIRNLNTNLTYLTIQSAIDASETLDGHTIFVEAETYYEHVNVNKSISLVGENRSTTIVDGNSTGTVISVEANNVNITGFTVQKSGINYPECGIYVGEWNIRNNISYNIIKNNRAGVCLRYSSNNTISGNSITTNNQSGILVYVSSNNTICGNDITNNKLGIRIELSSYNTFNGSNIVNNEFGIYFISSSNNIVFKNRMTGNTEYGIAIDQSSKNSIFENNLTNNDSGLTLRSSSNNTLHGNTMNDNEYNFGVLGSELGHFMHSIDVSNLVNGKPVYYLINQKDQVIRAATYPEIGYLALINSTNITVEDLPLTNNRQGLLLVYTNNSRVTENNIRNNRNGVWFFSSSNNTLSRNNITENTNYGIRLSSSSNNNTISRNDITNNGFGIWLWESSNNTIHHNNFVDNTEQVYSFDSTNVWDDGYPSGGNYWSDYKERYPDIEDVYSGPHQNETGSDGIWDHPYEILNEDNVDNYPLIPEFPIQTSMLLILVVLTAAIAVYKRRLFKRPICACMHAGKDAECTKGNKYQISKNHKLQRVLG